MKKYFIKNKWALIVYIAFIIGNIFCFNKSQTIANEANAPDLLLRVIGSRLMQDNKPVYFYKWKAGEPAAYYHFNQRLDQVVNGITVPPSILWLLQPLAVKNFCTAKSVWFFIQFFFLFATGLLTLINIKTVQQKLVAAVCFFIFFLTSQNWYVHIECSQVYIVYAFIFALFYYLEKRNIKNKLLIQGISIAFAAWMRPFFILLTLPYLLKIKVNFLKGLAVTGVAIVLLTTALNQWGYWKEYRAAMNEYSKETIHRMTYINAPLYTAVPTETIDCVYPITIKEKHGAGALYSLQKYLQDFGFKSSNLLLYTIITLLVCVFITLLIRAKTLTVEQHIVSLFLLYLAGELCAPAIRYPYNMVQWMVPALIVIAGNKNSLLASFLMIFGLLLNHEIPYHFKYEREIGEMLMIAAATIFVLKRMESNDVEKSLGTRQSNFPY